MFKRQYFRIDTIIPMKVNTVPPHLKDHVAARVEEFSDLKPFIVNISAGGMNFKSLKQYSKGDILEIIMTLPIPVKITLWVYGEVLRIEKTKNNNYQTFLKFINISDRIREKIANFVFQWEREVLKKSQLNFDTKFFDIPVSRLINGTSFPFEIFIRDKEGMKYLFPEGLPCDSIAQEFFEDNGISRIYIRADELSAFNDYIDKNKVKQKVFDRDDYYSFKEYSFNKKNYHLVDRNVLIKIKDIDFSLYMVNDFIYEPLIEASPEKIVTVDEEKLNTRYILIRKSDINKYHSKIMHQVSCIKRQASGIQPDPLSSDFCPHPLLFFKESAKILMYEVFEQPKNNDKMLKVISIATELVSSILKDSEAIYNLFSLNSGDFYTHIHSINVAVLSIGIGIILGLDKDSLEKLSIGALLHDIGHTAISEDIVNKQGRLSMREFEIFKTHVREGLKIVQMHKAIPEESYPAILCHHEKLSGNGYPLKITRDKIPLFGKITAIADAYDLLTTNRPYRPHMTPFQALSTIAKETNNYDPEVIKALIKITTIRNHQP
ncbi:hypothetical protein A45J_0482 [hot springs metagenome]|uniref:Uncharacterized protein n=1 Tax=hot springs metagenome TaxID=433727 RepID=A0A5J4L1W6_9ZZZZ